jgi:hypothetical protein
VAVGDRSENGGQSDGSVKGIFKVGFDAQAHILYELIDAEKFDGLIAGAFSEVAL